MKAMVLPRPDHISALGPALIIAAPTRPPMRACEELDGMPKYQVIRLPLIAPTGAPKIT